MRFIFVLKIKDIFRKEGSQVPLEIRPKAGKHLVLTLVGVVFKAFLKSLVIEIL